MIAQKAIEQFVYSASVCGSMITPMTMRGLRKRAGVRPPTSRSSKARRIETVTASVSSARSTLGGRGWGFKSACDILGISRGWRHCDCPYEVSGPVRFGYNLRASPARIRPLLPPPTARRSDRTTPDAVGNCGHSSDDARRKRAGVGTEVSTFRASARRSESQYLSRAKIFRNEVDQRAQRDSLHEEASNHSTITTTDHADNHRIRLFRLGTWTDYLILHHVPPQPTPGLST